MNDGSVLLSLRAEIQEAKSACQSMAHLDGGDVLCYDVCCVGSRVEQSTLKPVSEDKQDIIQERRQSKVKYTDWDVHYF